MSLNPSTLTCGCSVGFVVLGIDLSLSSIRLAGVVLYLVVQHYLSRVFAYDRRRTQSRYLRVIYFR